MKKERKLPLNIRVDPEIKAAMEAWAESRKLPLAWVAERAIEIGWPVVEKRGVEGMSAA